MDFPKLDEVQLSIERHGLKCVRGVWTDNDNLTRVDIDTTQKNSIDLFLDFAKTSGIKYIFLDSSILDGEALDSWLIETETITADDFGNNYRKIRNRAQKYNDEIINLSQSSPIKIELFFILDGTLYSLDYIAKWYEDLNVPESALEEICEEFAEELRAIKHRKLEEENKKRDMIVDLLVKEKSFQICTNKKARSAFARVYLNEKGFYGLGKQFPSVKAVEEVAELAWLKFKESK
ncbi:hypothetical protein H1S01_17545 [Heliobacterium chlorum]|uniref:Uncharacterized protein n=1 Tax=Heliobacterium chlorum TaxID=2698 RepID=A0ABR7T8C9_HELCL|nr:hypothetical protein [Heliobacterium chlorum]MBC9786265.1 hypothetical protein [Heliobacterium chlorum]